jgi:glycosyltransferase involved in cell wall biosynthesis
MTARVALVVPDWDEPLEPTLARVGALRDAGWDPWLLTAAPRPRRVRTPVGRELRERVTEVRPAGRSGGRNPFAAPLRALGPDLVHVRAGLVPAGWTDLRRIAAHPLVAEPRDDGRGTATVDPQGFWAAADAFAFPNQAMLDRALAGGCPAERAELLEPVALPPVTPPAARAPGPLRVVSIGPVIWEQGLEHSVHSVRLARGAGVDCEYRIVGSGDHLAAVAFARRQLEVEREVSLVEPGDEAAELAAADVFLDPTVTGTTVASALHAAAASGLRCVTTRSVDPPAVRIPRRDPRAIAGALAAIAAELSAGGRPPGGPPPGPTLAEHVARLLSIYEGVLTRTPRG